MRREIIHKLIYLGYYPISNHNHIKLIGAKIIFKSKAIGISAPIKRIFIVIQGRLLMGKNCYGGIHKLRRQARGEGGYPNSYATT